MIITVCSVKGGSGATVVAAGLAILSESPTLVVDLAGDVPDVLGCAASDRPGAHEWVRSDATPDRLGSLLARVSPDLQVLAGPRGGERADPRSPRWSDLAAWCAQWAEASGGRVVVDVGLAPPPALSDRASHRWLVIRNCYVALRRAAACDTQPSGVIVVEEPGRSLRRHDIRAATGGPIIATVPYDPAIARAVDSGMLTARLPKCLRTLGKAA